MDVHGTRLVGTLSARSLVLLFALVSQGCAQVRSQPEGLALLGLWQFPQRGVWIQINADGSAFQCRIAQNNVVISSRGKVAEDSKAIVWEQVWGTDRVTVAAETLTVEGVFGKFEFERAVVPMSDACLEIKSDLPVV